MAAASSELESSTMEKRINEILASAPNDDTATQVMSLAEDFWQFLDHYKPISDGMVPKFLKILVEKDGYAAAQLVVPDLRAAPGTTTGVPEKDKILVALINARAIHDALLPAIAPSATMQLYEAEKAIYAEVEEYRAGLELFGEENLTAAQQQEVRSRLASTRKPWSQLVVDSDTAGTSSA